MLVEVPRRAGWRFWFPRKIARQADESDEVMTLSIPPDFQAVIFRNEKGTDGQWRKVEEEQIDRALFINLLQPRDNAEAEELERSIQAHNVEVEKDAALVTSMNNVDDDIPF